MSLTSCTVTPCGTVHTRVYRIDLAQGHTYLSLPVLPPHQQADQALKRGQPKNKLRQEFPAPSGGGFERAGSLSDKGFDLLSRLLALDPEQRISAEDAKIHPWCAPPVCM